MTCESLLLKNIGYLQVTSKCFPIIINGLKNSINWYYHQDLEASHFIGKLKLHLKIQLLDNELYYYIRLDNFHYWVLQSFVPHIYLLVVLHFPKFRFRSHLQNLDFAWLVNHSLQNFLLRLHQAPLVKFCLLLFSSHHLNVKHQNSIHSFDFIIILWSKLFGHLYNLHETIKECFDRTIFSITLLLFSFSLISISSTYSKQLSVILLLGIRLILFLFYPTQSLGKNHKSLGFNVLQDLYSKRFTCTGHIWWFCFHNKINALGTYHLLMRDHSKDKVSDGNHRYFHEH